ncbi:MAG: GTP-binding protein [Geminicoccaceae bacterium]|nr:GTP-binding protein [Geminicoccaceae bacterium]
MRRETAAPDALLLTGPLGAGKTTLLERSLLPALAGRRVAVLVNDAGPVPFDSLLLSDTPIPILGVAGGCFCCRAGGRLLEALAEIRDRLAPDLVVLEGSGLSPPGPLARALQEEGYRLLGTIAVIAAAGLERALRDPLVRAQLAASGLVVLTGADRLDRAAFEKARSALQRLARAPVLPAFEGVVRGPVAALLAPGTAGAPSGSGVLHAGVRSATLRLAGLPRRAELCAWLARAPKRVLRVKGIVQCAEHCAALALNHALGETDLRPVAAASEWSELWVAHTDEEPRAWFARLPRGCAPDDWQELEATLAPLGEVDARTDAAFADGRRTDPLEAAQLLLDRLAAATRPVLVTSAARRAETAARWRGAIAEIAVVPDARARTIDALVARLSGDVLLFAGLPDALAERAAARRADLCALHLAQRFALPGPSVSLRIDPEREATLAALARHERPRSDPVVSAADEPRQSQAQDRKEKEEHDPNTLARQER